MESIVVAIMGGLFSLVGIWLKHYLEISRGATSSPSSNRKQKSKYDPVDLSISVPNAGNQSAASGVINIILALLIVLALNSESIDISDEFGWLFFFLGGFFLVNGVYKLLRMSN